MRKSLAILSLAALFYAGQSVASAINYSYIELGYLESELDLSGIDDDGDGYEFNLSLGVGQTIAVVVGYQDVEFDANVEASTQTLGIAYHKPYSNTGDMILGLAYLEFEAEASGGGSVDESGNELSLEIRSRTSPQNEVHFGLVRREIDGDSNSGYLFRIVNGNPQGFQFVIDYEDIDYGSSLMLGLRSAF
ncbi:MAG: hypothetical protein OEU50_12850 [Gammaproteobacteria bacterium]|nr:hypothetical protein [Gammaproteobacteria bacterium]